MNIYIRVSLPYMFTKAAMRIYRYTHIYIYIHICVYTQIYVRIYIYIYVLIYVRVCVYTCIYIYIYVCVRVAGAAVKGSDELQVVHLQKISEKPVHVKKTLYMHKQALYIYSPTHPQKSPIYIPKNPVLSQSCKSTKISAKKPCISTGWYIRKTALHIRQRAL